eukprot:5738855-Prymnesium_polylepis.1
MSENDKKFKSSQLSDLRVWDQVYGVPQLLGQDSSGRRAHGETGEGHNVECPWGRLEFCVRITSICACGRTGAGRWCTENAKYVPEVQRIQTGLGMGIVPGSWPSP